MPIGDLLASITGEKPAASAPPASRPAPAPKRKAEHELPSSTTKTPRTGTATNGIGRPNGTQPSSTSRIPDRPLTSSSTNLASASVPHRPSNNGATSSITKNAQNTPSKHGHSSTSANGNRPTPSSTAARITAAVDSGPKPEPKKRSFAEIMARAKAAQEAMANGHRPGTIQHKTIEKGTTKRERAEVKAVEARQAAKLARQGGARPGASALSNRSTNGVNGSAKTPNGKTTNGSGRKGTPVVEKKVKKAALATTGYTGTARPRPGASSTKTNGLPAKSGADARERPRYGGALSSSRRRYEDEDDDLDDFIEYDDDEEEPGFGGPRRGGYDSMEEDESDMEAGLTDVEEEERRAAMIARREDMEQEALEKRLKREKEEKRRRLMEAAAKRRA